MRAIRRATILAAVEEDNFLHDSLNRFLIQAAVLLPVEFLQRRRTLYRFWVEEHLARRQHLLGGDEDHE
jgi:hypothetical protein